MDFYGWPRYLVGYAPAIFRDAPMAYGLRTTSPEELHAYHCS